jgi:hypothetical protein
MRKRWLLLAAALWCVFGVPLLRAQEVDLGHQTTGRLPQSYSYGGTSGGSANAQTVSLSPATSAYTAGIALDFLPGFANTTTTPTLNLDGHGAKTVVKEPGNAALAASDMTTTSLAFVIYDGTYWELQNPQTAPAAGSVSCSGLPALTGDATSVAGNCTTTVADVGGTAAATIKTRSFGTSFGGTSTAETPASSMSGSVAYLTVPYACTISAWNMTLDSGTATIDVWKIATGTAIPTVTNTITASALPAISTGTAKHSTTLTGWTTSVTANDIFGFQLNTVATAKYVEIDLQCNQ